MYGNSLTFEGNLTKDPVLRSGKFGPSASFSVAHNHKSQSGAESVTFINCVANGPLAVNLANSLRKGDAVMIVGSITNYKTSDGKNHVGVKVEFAGPSLTFATADVERNPKGSYDKDAFIVDDDDEDEADEDEGEVEVKPAPTARRRKPAEEPAEKPARRSRVTKPADDDDDEFEF